MSYVRLSNVDDLLSLVIAFDAETVAFASCFCCRSRLTPRDFLGLPSEDTIGIAEA